MKKTGKIILPPGDRSGHRTSSVERRASRQRRDFAFTLLEAIVSILIFSLLMIAVGALWNVSWRAAERIARGSAGEQGAALVLRRLAQSVEASVFREKPVALYAGSGEDGGGGGMDRISFVTSMAPDVAEPSGETAPLERVSLQSQSGEKSSHQLVMLAGPLTMEERDWQRKTVLLDNLVAFRLRYWSEERKDWVAGWRDENHAPKAVQISFALKGEPLRTAAWPHQAVAWIRSPVKDEADAAPVAGTGTNAPAIKIGAVKP